MCKLKILPTAWEDLEKIEDWYTTEFGIETALRVSSGILDSIENLTFFPNIGVLTPDTWLNAQGYRMIICELHVAIFKRIDDTIYVYHIADTRMDYPKLFE